MKLNWLIGLKETVRSLESQEVMERPPPQRLTYHICKHAGLDCAMVGNIGYSFARQVAEDPKALVCGRDQQFSA